MEDKHKTFYFDSDFGFFIMLSVIPICITFFGGYVSYLTFLNGQSKIQVCQQMNTDSARSNCLDKLK